MNKLKQKEKEFKDGLLTKDDYIRQMHASHKTLGDYSEFIRDKNISSIQITGQDVMFQTRDGIKIVCPMEDERAVPFEILNFSDYEAEEIAMIRRFLKKDSIVLDIGANIGWYSLNLAKDVPDGRIIAFEPVPRSFEYLNKNITLNNYKNIIAYNFGLGDKEGELEFFYDPSLSAATSLAELYADRQKTKIKCAVRRLDDCILEITAKVDFIKCDVEGAELFVIKGAKQTIKRYKPVLFLEMLRKWSAKHGYHPNDIIKTLSEIGYECYCMINNRLQKIDVITEETIPTNFFFIPAGIYKS